jgi:hypothetical protein
VNPTSPRQATSGLGSYIVRIQTIPDPPVLNEMFGLRVTVFDAQNPAQPRTDATIEVDAVMPEHGHGMNTRARGSWQGDAFVADGLLFHMPGSWQIWVDITEEGRSDRARFELAVP